MSDEIVRTGTVPRLLVIRLHFAQPFDYAVQLVRMLAVLRPFSIGSRRKGRARTPDPDLTARTIRHRRNKSFSEFENLSVLIEQSQHFRRMSNGSAEIAMDRNPGMVHSPNNEAKKFPGLSFSRFNVGGRSETKEKDKKKKKRNNSPQADLQR